MLIIPNAATKPNANNIAPPILLLPVLPLDNEVFVSFFDKFASALVGCSKVGCSICEFNNNLGTRRA